MKEACPCGRGAALESCCGRYLGTEVPAPGTRVSLHLEEGAARLLAD